MSRATFDARNVKPWMRRRPFLGRLYALAVLPITPIAIVAGVLWSEREAFREVAEVFRCAFLPWRVPDPKQRASRKAVGGE